MRGEVGREQIHIARQILPRTRRPGDVGLTTQSPVHPHFPRDIRHLISEGRQRDGHVVDRIGQRRNLAFGLHRKALAQVTVRHRSYHLDDAAHLLSEVRRHKIDVVSKIFPGSADARHHCLAAQFALRANFAGDAGHFTGKRIELINHCINGIFQL